MNDLQLLLLEYDSLFQPPHGLPPTRRCDHRIILEPHTKQVVVRPYRYPHRQKDEIERQCVEMLQQGIIQPSQSPFSSPVILVPKADGSWHMCIDYRKLTAKTVKDKFSIPVIDELYGGLDTFLNWIYDPITLKYGCMKMMSRRQLLELIMVTEFLGHNQHTLTFQALMNDVFAPHLRKFILVFFDDILVYSHTWVKHLYHLRIFFKLLSQHHLFLKKLQVLFCSDPNFLFGSYSQTEGVLVDHAKISAMTDWPLPTTFWGLRGFLSLTGYYRNFVHNYIVIAAPLTTALKKNNLIWIDKAREAFELLKKAMTTTLILALPDFSHPFMVECDASDKLLGAVLQKYHKPIAYFSREMHNKHKYKPTYEKELIGLVEVICHWRSYLWGHPFVVMTDHYSLE